MSPIGNIYIMLALSFCNLLSCQRVITDIPQSEWVLNMGEYRTYEIYTCDVAKGQADQIVYAGGYNGNMVDSQNRVVFPVYGYNKQIAILTVNDSGVIIDRISIGNPDSELYFHSVETDLDGNIYISGHFSNYIDFNPSGNSIRLTTDNIDGFLCKFNKEFDCLWAIQSFVFSNFTVAGEGDVYAIIDDFDTGGNKFKLMEVSKDGDIGWVAEAAYGAEFTDIHVTHDGRILVIGETSNGSSRIFQDINEHECPETNSPEYQVESNERSFLMEIDGAGNCMNILWIPDGARSIDSDSENICVAGANYILLTDKELATIWIRDWSSMSEFRINDVILASSGKVYATGMFDDILDFDPGLYVDYRESVRNNGGFIIGLNEVGDYLGSNIWNDTTFFYDKGNNVLEGNAGDIYVAGNLSGINILAKLSENEL